jgi:hypothetical protein
LPLPPLIVGTGLAIDDVVNTISRNLVGDELPVALMLWSVTFHSYNTRQALTDDVTVQPAAGFIT